MILPYDAEYHRGRISPSSISEFSSAISGKVLTMSALNGMLRMKSGGSTRESVPGTNGSRLHRGGLHR